MSAVCNHSFLEGIDLESEVPLTGMMMDRKHHHKLNGTDYKAIKVKNIGGKPSWVMYIKVGEKG